MYALVVDDSRTVRKILGDLLRAAGLDVLEAAHGRAALELLQTSPCPAVALLDWNMPEMNGLELVRALRAQPRYATMPILMVTTETELANIALALEAGANEYAMKPFTAEVILDKLRWLQVWEDAHA